MLKEISKGFCGRLPYGGVSKGIHGATLEEINFWGNLLKNFGEKSKRRDQFSEVPLSLEEFLKDFSVFEEISQRIF